MIGGKIKTKNKCAVKTSLPFTWLRIVSLLKQARKVLNRVLNVYYGSNNRFRRQSRREKLANNIQVSILYICSDKLRHDYNQFLQVQPLKILYVF